MGASYTWRAGGVSPLFEAIQQGAEAPRSPGLATARPVRASVFLMHQASDFLTRPLHEWYPRHPVCSQPFLQQRRSHFQVSDKLPVRPPPPIIRLPCRLTEKSADRSRVKVVQQSPVVQEIAPLALLRVAGNFESTDDQVTHAGNFNRGLHIVQRVS